MAAQKQDGGTFLGPPCGHVAMRPSGQQPRLEHLAHSLLANTDFPKS